jgi:exosortase/archaeosortase
MAAKDFKCYFICFAILATIMFMLYAIDIIDVSNTVDFANLKRAKVVGKVCAFPFHSLSNLKTEYPIKRN